MSCQNRARYTITGDATGVATGKATGGGARKPGPSTTSSGSIEGGETGGDGASGTRAAPSAVWEEGAKNVGVSTTRMPSGSLVGPGEADGALEGPIVGPGEADGALEGATDGTGEAVRASSI